MQLKKAKAKLLLSRFVSLKRLKHITNWTIWSLIALYILLLVLIQIPAIQDGIGKRTSHFISKKIGTEVSIGRVDLGFFTRIIIDDVVIKDKQRVDMLKAGRLSVKLNPLSLMEGKILIRWQNVRYMSKRSIKKKSKMSCLRKYKHILAIY